MWKYLGKRRAQILGQTLKLRDILDREVGKIKEEEKYLYLSIFPDVGLLEKRERIDM